MKISSNKIKCLLIHYVYLWENKKLTQLNLALHISNSYLRVDMLAIWNLPPHINL